MSSNLNFRIYPNQLEHYSNIPPDKLVRYHTWSSYQYILQAYLLLFYGLPWSASLSLSKMCLKYDSLFNIMKIIIGQIPLSWFMCHNFQAVLAYAYCSQWELPPGVLHNVQEIKTLWVQSCKKIRVRSAHLTKKIQNLIQNCIVQGRFSRGGMTESGMQKQWF